MVGEVDKLIDSLPHLSADDLRALHARAAALLSLSPGITRKGQLDDFPEAFYAALNKALEKRTGAAGMPYAVFMRQQASAMRYREMCAVAAAYNAASFPKQTKVDRQSMLALYADMLLDHLASRRLPLTWHSTIPNAIGNLAGIVEDNFPGYAACGLLSLVQSRRTRPAAPIPA